MARQLILGVLTFLLAASASQVRASHGTGSACFQPLAIAAGPQSGEEPGPFQGGFEDDPAEKLNEKVSSLYDDGKYEEALPLARQALQVCEQAYGKDDAAVAKPLNNLAWLLQATGDYAGARPLFERALAINEKALGPDDPEVATSLNNLAALLSFQGDPASARPLYERALAIQEKSLAPDDPIMSDTLNNLAVLLESTGHADKSLPLYERALSIAEKSLGAEHPNVATSLNNLGSVYESLGNLERARSYFERALKVRQKSLPADHPDLAESLNNLALVRSAQGAKDEARQLLVRALAIYERSLGPEHPDVASTLNNLAGLDWQQGKQEQARAGLLRAAAIINRHVEGVLPGLSFAEQRAFLQSKIPEEAALLLSTCRQGKELACAYNFIFRWKGLLIEALRWQKAVTSLAENPTYKPLVEKLQDLREELAAWYHEAGLVPYGQWKAKNDRLTADKEQLERELARALKSSSFRDVLADYSLAEFLKLLSADEVLVDLYRYQLIGEPAATEQKYAAVLSGRGGPIAFVELGSARKIDQELFAWRKQVLVRNEAASEWQNLKQTLWTTIAAALPAGATRVWLSPDSQLSRLPWHLFPSGDKKAQAVEISQIDSSRELAGLRLLKPPETPARPLLVVAGGVDFNAGPPGEGEPAVRELPGTLKEAEHLRKLALSLGMQVDLLKESEANKSRVRELLPSATWIHLATHGFFFDEARAARTSRVLTDGKRTARRPLRNPLVESGIILARDQSRKTEVGSGRFLTAEELLGMDLSKAELFALSACETGLGESATGQGVLGLRAAIMAAGARSILMSLWKVPDESTLALMNEFYNNLWVKKLPKVEALRQAQITVAGQPYDRFKEPVHWAGWVLVGDGW